MTVGIDRFKASSHPTQQHGIYLGVVKTVTPDKKAYVYIPKFLNTVGPMRSVSGFSLVPDTMVLCAHVGGGNEEMYIIGATNTTDAPLFTPTITSPVAGDYLRYDGVNWVNVNFIYKVGDTGPGGGIIFFVDRYNEYADFSVLEVAPVGVQVQRIWATNANSNQTTAVFGADSRGLGAGYQNTIDIVAQTGNVAATCAAAYCADLVSGGRSDWYLPSISEVELIRNVVYNELGVGGFVNGGYWSSTENSTSTAWYHTFHEANFITQAKSQNFYVRPVRRF